MLASIEGKSRRTRVGEVREGYFSGQLGSVVETVICCLGIRMLTKLGIWDKSSLVGRIKSFWGGEHIVLKIDNRVNILRIRVAVSTTRVRTRLR